MPPGGAGISRHCSSSGQSGSALQATVAAIQPPATTITASPVTTLAKPAVTSPWEDAVCPDGSWTSPPAQTPPPAAISAAPTAPSVRGPLWSPEQPAAASPITRASPRNRRETVRDDLSSISSTALHAMSSRFGFPLLVGAALSAALAASARADDNLLRGPHPFLKENDLEAHVLIANGLGSSMSGAKLAFDYGYRLTSGPYALGIDLALNLQQAACTQTGSQGVC